MGTVSLKTASQVQNCWTVQNCAAVHGPSVLQGLTIKYMNILLPVTYVTLQDHSCNKSVHIHQKGTLAIIKMLLSIESPCYPRHMTALTQEHWHSTFNL